MQIKSIVAGAAIALVAGLGSVSGNELYVADTATDPGTPYAVLEGVAAERLTAAELSGTHGAQMDITITTTIPNTAIRANRTLPEGVTLPGGDVHILAPGFSPF